MKNSVRWLLMVAVIAALLIGSGAAQADDTPQPQQPDVTHKIYLPFVARGCTLTNIAQNGSFEAGAVNWTDTDTQQINIFQSSIVYDGTWVAALGDKNYYNAALYQPLNIPAGMTSIKVEFYARVYSADLTSGNYDKLYASWQPVSGVTQPETLIASNATQRQVWKKYTVIYNALPNPAQAKRLYFRASTDGSLISTFRIDAVKVWAQCTPFAAANLAPGSADPIVTVDDITLPPLTETPLSPKPVVQAPGGSINPVPMEEISGE